MIRTEAYKRGDIFYLKPRGCFDGDKTLHDRVEAAADSASSYVYSVFADEKLIAVIGLSLIFDHVGEVWSVASDEVTKYKKDYFKTCVRMIANGKHVLELRRLQGLLVCDYEGGHRWFEALGFEKEALLKKFGPEGKDYYMYARLY